MTEEKSMLDTLAERVNGDANLVRRGRFAPSWGLQFRLSDLAEGSKAEYFAKGGQAWI